MSDARSASLQTQSQTPTVAASFGYGPSAQRPVNPKNGFLYWDTTINREVVYTAAGWQIIGVQPTAMVGFGTTAQRPTSPTPGFIYYDTALSAQFTWVGSGWVQTSPGAAAAAMVGAGPTVSRPTNAPFGFLYHDTTTGQEIVWNSQAWIIIGPGQVTGGPPTPPPTPGPSTPAPVIFSSTSVAGGVGTFFSYQVQATNTPTSYACDSTTALGLVGLSFNTTTGLLSGTPTGIFSATVTFGATNSSGTGTLPVTITINAAPVTSGRWSTALGQCTVYAAYACSMGAIVAESTPSVITFFLTAESGPLPPGVTWQLYDPNGTLLGTETTDGGQATTGNTFNINLGGGYNVVVSTASSTVKVRVGFTISSGSLLCNSSVRATLANPVISGDQTSGQITLTIAGITPTTTLSLAAFSGVEGNVTTGFLTAPNYTWNFGGDTTNNPKSNFSSGLTSLVLAGEGRPTSISDVIIGING